MAEPHRAPAGRRRSGNSSGIQVCPRCRDVGCIGQKRLLARTESEFPTKHVEQAVSCVGPRVGMAWVQGRGDIVSWLKIANKPRQLCAHIGCTNRQACHPASPPHVGIFEAHLINPEGCASAIRESGGSPCRCCEAPLDTPRPRQRTVHLLSGFRPCLASTGNLEISH